MSGTFLFNRYPAKIFLGDGGSLLLGWMFVIMSFYFAKISSVQNPIMLPAVIFSIPIIDVFFVVILRFIKGEKSNFYRILNIFKSDRNHFHHLLLKKINSEKITVITIYLITLFLMVLALLVFNAKIKVDLILFATFIYLFIIILRIALFKAIK